ncbi:MAG: hypothetical protein US89_C0013G0019 [Candidatus Peregrinibacteria bacterium GW2011_GWF2_38_29]|nr:MAG: hypothetical protein US89_C0013G0019 [Candidatus Peregrinibacteria bacterium GW2011_GWF2_38_29]HBB02400.1 hypothetical protein [Candidatus Peregrinibacteria bacterium]
MLNEIGIGIKSFRIFFSYSTVDKLIVGEIKKHLELLGFEVFLAHEDIEPCIDWQEEIKKNLLRCDVFIPLYSKNFRDSKWTDQETGIAIASEKFIIPLHMDLAPYGFMGKTQGLKIDEKLLALTANEIVKIIKSKSKFKDDMKNFTINALARSSSFDEAKFRARQLSGFDTFSEEEVLRVYSAVLSTNQISGSFGARSVLIHFFEKYKAFLGEEDFNIVWQVLTT